MGRAIALNLWDVNEDTNKDKKKNYQNALNNLYDSYKSQLGDESYYQTKPNFRSIIGSFYSSTKHAILNETIFPVHYDDHIKATYESALRKYKISKPQGRIKDKLIYSENSTHLLLEVDRERINKIVPNEH